MKTIGVLVDIPVELYSETKRKQVVFEHGKKLVHVVVLRSVYGMLVASLLFYKKYLGDLEKIGFEFNPYNPCVANRIKVVKQHTVSLRVDNVMSSHVKPKVNDNFKEWINRNYSKHGELKEN